MIRGAILGGLTALVIALSSGNAAAEEAKPPEPEKVVKTEEKPEQKRDYSNIEVKLDANNPEDFELLLKGGYLNQDFDEFYSLFEKKAGKEAGDITRKLFAVTGQERIKLYEQYKALFFKYDLMPEFQKAWKNYLDFKGKERGKIDHSDNVLPFDEIVDMDMWNFIEKQDSLVFVYLGPKLEKKGIRDAFHKLASQDKKSNNLYMELLLLPDTTKEFLKTIQDITLLTEQKVISHFVAGGPNLLVIKGKKLQECLPVKEASSIIGIVEAYNGKKPEDEF
ncbi:hypothetical protein GOV06_01070 [Candidatus Woesearchaeota archaeon]|nr:hypothetical protein [Candidatus Woesearchaeota archaeon]